MVLGYVFVDTGGVKLLAASVSSDSAITAAIDRARDLAAPVTSDSSITAAIGRVQLLSAAVISDSIITADVIGNRYLDLQAALSSDSIIVASIDRTRYVDLAAVVTSDSVITANLSAAQFLVYSQGEVVKRLGGSARSLDIETLGLAYGSWPLEVSRVDAYGTESDRVPIIATVADAGGGEQTVEARIASPSNLSTRAVAGGYVELSWLLKAQPGQQAPTQFVVATVADPGTTLETVNVFGRNAFTAIVGPFTHGSSVSLAVRAQDADSTGLWVPAPTAVADSVGPTPPVIAGQS
jgi:hypothetical protein